mmetsp:Transcript_233/g.1826  ORF Transcript_233/g.1826 Transcript_233/m.1826 type:complete len:267 (-) Transcript_233:164-964(-)
MKRGTDSTHTRTCVVPASTTVTGECHSSVKERAGYPQRYKYKLADQDWPGVESTDGHDVHSQPAFHDSPYGRAHCQSQHRQEIGPAHFLLPLFTQEIHRGTVSQSQLQPWHGWRTRWLQGVFQKRPGPKCGKDRRSHCNVSTCGHVDGGRVHFRHPIGHLAHHSRGCRFLHVCKPYAWVDFSSLSSVEAVHEQHVVRRFHFHSGFVILSCSFEHFVLGPYGLFEGGCLSQSQHVPCVFQGHGFQGRTSRITRGMSFGTCFSSVLPA